MDATVERSLEKLKAAHPWPMNPPGVPRHFDGWLWDSTRAVLASVLSPDTHLVIECGSWLGMSARMIVESAPNATLVCIDTWKGSPQLLHFEYLSILYECFIQNLWNDRHRVIPVRADSLDGLAEVFDAGVVPDVVYLDSDHTYERLNAELAFCLPRWPSAVIVGDDYQHPDHPGVKQAALEWSERTQRAFSDNGNAFKFGPVP